MKFRKFMCTVIAVALVSGISGCGSKEEKKKVDIILKLPPISMDSQNDKGITETEQFLKKASDAFIKQYKDADVTFDIELFEYTKENAAITDCFGTEKAADILYEGYFNMGTYIHTGRVVPLDDIISDNLRSDISDSIWDMSSVGGKTYMMPFLGLQNVLGYNKELFSQCGLDKYINKETGNIDSWTIDEWEEILDTLSAKLPANCYPMMMYAKNDQGDTHVMTFIRSQGSNIFDDDNNFNINTPEGIKALEWLLNGKEKGWYPDSCESLEITDCTELFRNNQLAICMINNASFSIYDKEKFGAVNFPFAGGDGIATSFVTGFEVFDNGDEDKVKVAKDFISFICENEEWASYATGGIPSRESIARKYADDIYLLNACIDNNKNIVDFTHNNPNWRGVRDVFYKQMNSLFTKQKTPAEVARDIDKECNEAIEKGRQESKLHE